MSTIDDRQRQENQQVNDPAAGPGQVRDGRVDLYAGFCDRRRQR
jgi:hypothetical protein